MPASASSRRAAGGSAYLRERVPIDLAGAQRGLPHHEGLFVRKARRDEGQDVLDPVDEIVRMPRHERFRPVHVRVRHPCTPRMRPRGDVMPVVVPEDEQAQTASLRDAGEDDPSLRGRQQHPVRGRQGHPAVAHPHDGAVRYRAVERAARVARLVQRGRRSYPGARSERLDESRPARPLSRDDGGRHVVHCAGALALGAALGDECG